MKHIVHFIRTRIYLSIGAFVVLLLIGYAFVQGTKETPPNLTTVRRGTITQTVSVTGKTKPASDSDLAFEKAGRVNRVSVKIGDEVSVGQVLAELDTSELRAQ